MVIPAAKNLVLHFEVFVGNSESKIISRREGHRFSHCRMTQCHPHGRLDMGTLMRRFRRDTVDKSLHQKERNNLVL